jgi:hypothetical protein
MEKADVHVPGVSRVAWRTSGPFQPTRKIHRTDIVLDSHVRDRPFDDVERLSDPGNPLVASNRRKALARFTGHESHAPGRSSGPPTPPLLAQTLQPREGIGCDGAIPGLNFGELATGGLV